MIFSRALIWYLNSTYHTEFQSNSSQDDEDEDPLDAFMAGLEQQAAKDLVASKENATKADSGRGTRGDIDELDDEESYYK